MIRTIRSGALYVEIANGGIQIPPFGLSTKAMERLSMPGRETAALWKTATRGHLSRLLQREWLCPHRLRRCRAAVRPEAPFPTSHYYFMLEVI
jgi:hypothetical protein